MEDLRSTDDRLNDTEATSQLGPADALTLREREVLEFLDTGASNAGIAESTVITQRAAEKYIHHLHQAWASRATGSESR
jgi:DNA-binding NarL/FixJ family response regulator